MIIEENRDCPIANTMHPSADKLKAQIGAIASLSFSSLRAMARRLASYGI
ncbi:MULTISPECIES: hypothetical protein [unclassified Microcoleus]